MIVTERDCEIVKQLVAVFCDHDPEGIDISVGECLDLFARMVLASWDRGPVSESNTGAGGATEALAGAERERERRRRGAAPIRLPMTLPAAA